MRYLALLALLFGRCADLILATDAYRGLRPASKAERALLEGRWR
jgi:hypothetical protein